MEIILGIDQIKNPFVNPVVTLGNFDGIHLGHQRIFEKVIEEAKKIHGESVVITFDPHPLKILHPEKCPPLLTPFRKKMMLIEKTGIEKVLCIPFTRAFAEISPLEFVQQVLVERIKAKKIIVGYNYRFGKGKIGNVETLKNHCQLFNVEVEVVAALKVHDTIVSSSKIRELLKEGEVEKASTLLGKDYSVIGRVIEGARRGHLLGFPTANLEISDELYPKPGVYAVGVEWHSQLFNGVANIGFNPTFDSKVFSIEVFILNFDQNIYGNEIQVSFRRRIRNEIRFNSPSDLIDQIKQDVKWAKDHVF